MTAPRLQLPFSPSRRRLVGALGGLGSVGALGLLTGCGGDGSSFDDIATSLSTTTPENQAATYRNVDRLYATRRFARGANVRALPAHAVSLESMRYDAGAGSMSVADYMTKGRTAGLLILKDGRVALERYAMGNTPQSVWTSFSGAKSVTSTLIGLALQEGKIRSLDDRVDDYVPALRGSAYAGCSIRSLLRMTSGVNWIESYSTTGPSDVALLAQAFSSNQGGAALQVLLNRSRAAPVGTVFNYSTGESYILGAVLAAAVGSNLSDYLTRRLWSQAGMEADGYWMLDAPGGLEMGGNNFSATLRDYARFGQFVLDGGAGSSRLPDGWLALAGQSDADVTAPGNLYPDYPLGYGYQWWAFPGDPSFAPHDGAFTAEGIFGQFVYVNPAHRVVAVVWSAWSEPWITELEFETFALLGTAVAMLAG